MISWSISNHSNDDWINRDCTYSPSDSSIHTLFKLPADTTCCHGWNCGVAFLWASKEGLGECLSPRPAHDAHHSHLPSSSALLRARSIICCTTARVCLSLIPCVSYSRSHVLLACSREYYSLLQILPYINGRNKHGIERCSCCRGEHLRSLSRCETMGNSRRLLN
jgi:hypothetical protein